MLGKACNVVVVPEIRYTMRYVGYRFPPPKRVDTVKAFQRIKFLYHFPLPQRKTKTGPARRQLLARALESFRTSPRRITNVYDCNRLARARTKETNLQRCCVRPACCGGRAWGDARYMCAARHTCCRRMQKESRAPANSDRGCTMGRDSQTKPRAHEAKRLAGAATRNNEPGSNAGIFAPHLRFRATVLQNCFRRRSKFVFLLFGALLFCAPHFRARC